MDWHSLVASASSETGKQSLSIPLPDRADAKCIVNLVQGGSNDWIRVGGELTGNTNGGFMLASNGSKVSGFVHFRQEGVVYRLETQEDGRIVMLKKSSSDLVCAPLPRMKHEPVRGRAAGQPSPVPVLNSRPAATAQLYLDFDGETVTDPAWNNGRTIIAAGYDLSGEEVTAI